MPKSGIPRTSHPQRAWRPWASVGVTVAEVAVAAMEMELAYRLLDRGTTANLQGLADVLRHRKVPLDSERALEG